MWKFTKYSSIVGFLILGLSFLASSSSPQQAAGAAIGIGLAVVPYCWARAEDMIQEQQKRDPEEEFSIDEEL